MYLLKNYNFIYRILKIVERALGLIININYQTLM